MFGREIIIMFVVVFNVHLHGGLTRQKCDTGCPHGVQTDP